MSDLCRDEEKGGKTSNIASSRFEVYYLSVLKILSIVVAKFFYGHAFSKTFFSELEGNHPFWSLGNCLLDLFLGT